MADAQAPPATTPDVQSKERMETLEHRFHMIERLHSKQNAGPCETFCVLCYDILRSIPYNSMLAIVPTIIGAVIMHKYMAETQLAVSYLQLPQQAHLASHYIVYFMISVLVVDCVVLLAAFPATGATREYIFGHERHGLMLLIQFIAGPITYTIIMVVLALHFLALYTVTMAMLPASTLLAIVAGACGDGMAAKGGLIEAFVWLANYEDSKMIEESVTHLCLHHPWNLSASAAMFTTGLSLCVLGQVWQLCMHVCNMERVSMSDDMDEESDREAIKEYYAKSAH